MTFLSPHYLGVVIISTGSSELWDSLYHFSPPQGMSGGTTVAGTMLCAHRAGIPVFVTGGIGGVHRGGEASETHGVY